MDGNGRWAHQRGRDRTFGHLRGARVARKIVEECSKLGIKHLTLYSFSTENWLRPKNEVAFLMHLLVRHLRRERGTLMKNNVRFSTIGDLQRLPEDVRLEVEKTERETIGNTGLHLVFALSYGGRQEITNAVKQLAEEIEAGRMRPEEVDETAIQSRLQTASIPNPDLIIRTSGEFRLSNFLLWQSAYAELYFSDTLWPDFTLEEFHGALDSFAQRERRFGKTGAQMQAPHLVVHNQLT